MADAKLVENKVIVEDKELVGELNEGLYGKLEEGKIKLDLVEAVLLCERQRIEIYKEDKKINFEEFLHFCSENDPRFMTRYFVYRDLRERGLPVKIGFKGCDFRVYERGAKPGKAESVKWIVFAASEDYPCALEQLGKAIKLAQNIKAEALWAVVDNDADVTHYLINTCLP